MTTVTVLSLNPEQNPNFIRIFSMLSLSLLAVCGGNDTCIGCDGVYGSGAIEDACGVCDGKNKSCFCPENEIGSYRGYSENELDKILLLYEIEYTINTLQKLDGKIDEAYKKILEQSTEEVDLGNQIAALREWNSLCLDEFCTNLTTLFDALEVDTSQTPAYDPAKCCGV